MSIIHDFKAINQRCQEISRHIVPKAPEPPAPPAPDYPDCCRCLDRGWVWESFHHIWRECPDCGNPEENPMPMGR